MHKVGLLLIAVGLIFVLCGPALAEAPRTHTLSPGEGTIVEQWNPGISPEMIITFTEDGKFLITGGWVFDAPLFVDGYEYETTIIPGEAADQITPGIREVHAGDTMTWTPTQAENGSELGVRYLYFTGDTQETEVGLGWNQELLFQWDGVIPDPILMMGFNASGQVRITGGWAFDAPVMLNLEPIETLIVPGEEAAQIRPFIANVEAGEVWEWELNNRLSGSELGLRLDFVKTLYLPVIRN